jgi:hypothetical protein
LVNTLMRMDTSIAKTAVRALMGQSGDLAAWNLFACTALHG